MCLAHSSKYVLQRSTFHSVDHNYVLGEPANYQVRNSKSKLPSYSFYTPVTYIAPFYAAKKDIKVTLQLKS